MSLIVLDDVCPLCSKPFAEGEDAYSAWGMFTTGDLAPFCSRAMHWGCYLAWPRRPEFAKLALDGWRLHVGEGKEFHRVLEQPAVHVSVRMPHDGGEVVLFFRELGHALHVSLDDWDAWLRFPPTGVNPSVATAWLAVRDPVRAALPSATMIRGNYPHIPEGASAEFECVTDEAVYIRTIKEDRWKELLDLQKEGMEKSYFRRLIEFVSCYPDDADASDRLRDGRPWVDKFLFEPRKLTVTREAGLLWVLLGGWPRPTDRAVRAAALRYCREVVAGFPDTRAAGSAERLIKKWGLKE